jgi:hypothetical protein
MIYISEWLPNPAGKDAGEWVELFNGGNSAVNLSGWKLKTANGKTFPLTGNIPEGQYVVLEKSRFGFSLKNTSERLALLNPAGRIADESAYFGPAPEGKSVNHNGAASYFAEPTPGAANTIFKAEISSSPYVSGEIINPSSRTGPFLGMMTGTALALALFAVMILKNHAQSSELFFYGD